MHTVSYCCSFNKACYWLIILEDHDIILDIITSLRLQVKIDMDNEQRLAQELGFSDDDIDALRTHCEQAKTVLLFNF